MTAVMEVVTEMSVRRRSSIVVLFVAFSVNHRSLECSSSILLSIGLSFVRSFLRPFARPLVRLFACSLRLFACSLVRLFACLLVCSPAMKEDGVWRGIFFLDLSFVVERSPFGRPRAARCCPLSGFDRDDGAGSFTEMF